MHLNSFLSHLIKLHYHFITVEELMTEYWAKLWNL